jgi:hypothetical protein
MKATRVTTAGAVLAGLVFPFASQAADAVQGIPGYLNPSTGVFSARPALTPAAAAIAATGKIVVTINLTFDSKIPLAQIVTCSVSISSIDSSFTNNASASDIVVKTSASAGSCKVAIPYIWEIASASTMMNVSVDVNTNTPNLFHEASFTAAPFAVPSGKTNLPAITLAM